MRMAYSERRRPKAPVKRGAPPKTRKTQSIPQKREKPNCHDIVSQYFEINDIESGDEFTVNE